MKIKKTEQEPFAVPVSFFTKIFPNLRNKLTFLLGNCIVVIYCNYTRLLSREVFFRIAAVYYKQVGE